MKIAQLKDKRGIANLALILGIAAVLVIGGVGYYVYNKNKKDNDKTASNALTSAATDACNKLYNDKDLCKFVSSYSTKAAYKSTFTTTDKSGKVTTMLLESDGKNNSSMVTKDGSSETSAFVTLNGDNYIKDEADGTWTKYAKNTSSPTATNEPTNDLKISNDEQNKPAEQRISYKKLGKEKVGSVNCFKYQVSDPSQPNTESIVWFGDKDYQLRKWSFKDKDGTTNVGEFTYTSVTISAPSPVKEAPSVPSQADIQKYLNQAQSETNQ